MEHTPSLSRSSTSPPNPYSPSEASSFGYPSPIIAAQHPSLYGIDSFCPMAPTRDSDIPLFTLAAVGQDSWEQKAATPGQARSSAIPSTLSMEYDPFSRVGPAGPAVYSPGIYHRSQQMRRSAPLSSSPSSFIATTQPQPDPAPGSPASFTVASAVASRPPVAIREHGEIDTSISPYGRMVNSPAFIPARGAHVPYQMEPTALYGADSSTANSNGYIGGGAPPVWDQAGSTSNQYFAGADNHRQQSRGAAMERQSHSTRARRQPRRLTTREEANFQCEVKGCGKLFSRSYNYKAHLETHDEKREYPFPCQVPGCGKRFVRKTDLQRHHQSVHMKERNHGCDYCGRLFARKDTLRRHMDDGCSKRFDIGTLDLRTENTSNTSGQPSGDIWPTK